MTFLPIVARELRVAARRRGTYWSRSVTAMVAIILGLFVYLNCLQEPPAQVGQSLFYTISWLAFIYCLVTGVRSTADCLSEEKREGTLGLLFLTDLKGYDVVGGKLVATSLNAFYGLTAIFPVLAIPLLMGGITNGELWRMSLVLANTFLLSLSMGMFMSSISKSPRKAMAGTFILVLFFSIGLVLCQAWISYIYRSPGLTHVSYLLNPGYALTLVSDLRFKASKDDFWTSVGLIHGFCWLFLVLASLIVPRSWQDHPPGERTAGWRELWHRWSFGDVEGRVAFRRRLLNINAFFWLAARERLKPANVWVALGVLAAIWVWVGKKLGMSWLSDGGYIFAAIIMNTGLKIWVTSQAGRRLTEERKMGSLELLLSTPLGVKDILHGQILALRRQFLWPLMTVLILECVFLGASLRSKGIDAETRPAFIAWWVAYMMMLVADIPALSAANMWACLTTRHPNRATGLTIARVLAAPVILWTVILMLHAMFQTFFRPAGSYSEPSWKFYLGLYFGLGILSDLYFGLRSWWLLQTRFREVAVQRFSEKAPLLRRLFGGRSQPAPELPPVIAR